VTANDSFQAPWSKSQIDWQIHVKELYAVYYAVSQRLTDFAGKNLLIWTDNQSVLYAINKAKAHVSNRQLLLDFFTMTSLANICVKAVYIPSKLNTTADLLSRHMYSA
jgi:hypothetical protein